MNAGTIYYEPFADYLRITRGGTEPLAGVFVGGCVERGVGSSFRRKAHAHYGGKWSGWICVRSARRLYKPDGSASLLMWHELAHIISKQGHTAKFEKVMRELCGRSDVKGYRKRKAAQRTAAKAAPVTYRWEPFEFYCRRAHRPYCSACWRNAEGYLVRIKGNNMRSDAMCRACADAKMKASRNDPPAQ